MYKNSLLFSSTFKFSNSPVETTISSKSIGALPEELVNKVFNDYKPRVVVNLAAQAGVRYSIDHPDVYIESNLIGFAKLLEKFEYITPFCRSSFSLFLNSIEELFSIVSTSKSSDNEK